MYLSVTPSLESGSHDLQFECCCYYGQLVILDEESSSDDILAHMEKDIFSEDRYQRTHRCQNTVGIIDIIGHQQISS